MQRRRTGRAWQGVLAMLAAITAMLVSSTAPAPGAVGVSVDTQVSSQVQLANNCTQPQAWSLGTVLPGSTGMTDTGSGVCSLSFVSNNDSAMLRIAQSDYAGTAMTMDFSGVNWNTSRSGTTVLNALTAVDANNAWAVGSSSILSKTGATTWSQVNASCSYLSVDAAASNLVWAGGYSGCIRRYNGATWNAVASPNPSGTADVTAMEAFDATHAWLGYDDGKIYFWNGAAFTDVTPAGSTTKILTIESFHPNSTYVYFGDTAGKVFRSATGGTAAGSWAAMTNPQGGADVADLVVAPWAGGQDTIWAISNYGKGLYRSTNGGSSWTNTWTATGGVSVSAIGIDPAATAVATAKLYMSGNERNAYAVTSDGGTTVTAIESLPATTNQLKDVAVVSATTAFMAGDGQAIVGTTDGTTFTRHTTPSYQDTLWSISTPTANTMYAVGGNGAHVRTTNGGTTWADPCSPACPLSSHLYGVSFYDATHGWEVGDGGVIRSTSDGGVSWTVQPAPGGYTGRINSVYAYDANNAFAVGWGGKVFRWNGGSWSDVSPAGVTEDLRSVSMSDDSHAFVVGAGRRLAATADRGQTWSTALGVAGSAFFSVAAIHSSPTTAYAFDEVNAKVYRTTNGVSWTNIGTFNVSNVPQTFNTVDGMVMYAAGSFSKLGRTTDGTMAGSSNIINSNGPSVIYSIGLPDDHNVWVVGSGGEISYKQSSVSIPDFDPATNNWSNASTLFAVCVQRVAFASADWTPDTFNTPAHCETTDVGPWYAVPTSAAKIAHTTAAGQTGTVDLVYGLLASNSATPGTYRSTVLIEALAPNV